MCFFCFVIHFLKISEFFIYLFWPLCLQDREAKGMEFSSKRWGNWEDFRGGETTTRVYYAKKVQ